MNNQRKITRTSAYASLGGAILALVLPFMTFGLRGTAGDIALVIFLAVMLVTAVAVPVCLATWSENGKRPGSTPLIYGVIAVPAGIVLFFLTALSQLASVALFGILLGITGIAAVIIGIVKKLSVNTVTSG